MDPLLDTLVIIPARKGSVRLPGKNRKSWQGKPLYLHTLSQALELFPPENICLTTDDEVILAEQAHLPKLIHRAPELATSETPMAAVILDCLTRFPGYRYGLLLQPTSPLREKTHILEAFSLLKPQAQAVISVFPDSGLPDATLHHLNAGGWIEPFPENDKALREGVRFNGAVYWFHTGDFQKCGGFGQMTRIRPYGMPPEASVDIDTEADWILAEKRIYPENSSQREN